LLCGKLSLSLLGGQLLPASFLLCVLVGLSLLDHTASISLLLLLLSLRQLLLQLDFMLALSLLLMLHANSLDSLESRESGLEWHHTTSVIHNGGL
jgi:hypothetical protein